MSRVFLATVSLVLLWGCGPNHIRPFTPRARKYEPGPYEKAPKQLSDGSLWQDSSRSLIADFRAMRVGDLVRIRVDESPQAQGDATTSMERETSMNLGVPRLLGFAQALSSSNPDLDTSQLIDLLSQAYFEGSGETSRGSRVQGSIAARVRSSLPTVDLFIEGKKVLLFND